MTARLAIATLLLALAAPRARAQGCVATGASGLMIGHESELLSRAPEGAPASAELGGPYLPKGRFQAGLGWRWIRSHRHFIGSTEQPQRAQQGTEVVNTMNLLDLAVTYGLSERWSITAGLPYFRATRSSGGGSSARVVTESQGIGDMRVTADAWLWRPSERTRGNVQLGLGIKLPTGADDLTDNQAPKAGFDANRSVDQSIQPGDGGVGVIVEGQAFREIPWRTALYAQGTYLLNPRGNNGVTTARGAAGEELMSVADQYLLRAGAARPLFGGLGFSAGLRLEGVPPHDVLGPSDGFRRPGYTFSVEPGLSWGRGGTTVTLLMPYAWRRERQKSLPDEVYGRHGDAAFADYSLQLAVAQRF